MEPATLVFIGGAPVGPRHIEWNFISSREERIEEAKAAWRAGALPTIPGDDHELIPLP